MIDFRKHLGTGVFGLIIVSLCYGFQQERNRVDEVLSTFTKKGDVETEFINLALSNTIYTNSNGQIINATPSVARMFGYSVEEMRGMPIVSLMPESFRARHQAGFGAKMADPHPADTTVVLEAKCEGLRKDKTTFPVEIRTRLMDSQNGRVGMSRLTEVDKIMQVDAD